MSSATQKVSFSSMLKLKNFLTKTEKGKALLHQCMAEEMPSWLSTEDGCEWQERILKANERGHLLIVIHGDGWCEVFSDNRTRVETVEVALDGPGAAGSDVHQKCKEYAANELPSVWRRVWASGRLVTHFLVRPKTFNDLVRQEVDRAILYAASLRKAKDD